jgi:hypothetical protein
MCDRCLDTVECYNVFQGQSSEGLGGCWTTIARVPGQGRIGPAVAVHGGSLYVLGGYNRDALPHAVLDDVQCLDLANKNSRWLVSAWVWLDIASSDWPARRSQ